MNVVQVLSTDLVLLLRNYIHSNEIMDTENDEVLLAVLLWRCWTVAGGKTLMSKMSILL